MFNNQPIMTAPATTAAPTSNTSNQQNTQTSKTKKTPFFFIQANFKKTKKPSPA